MPEKTVSIVPLWLSDGILRFKLAGLAILVLGGGCYVEAPAGVRSPVAPPPMVVSPKPPRPVYVAPPADTHQGLFSPIGQPAPVAVPEPPPPPLAEAPHPQTSGRRLWVRGFWDWDGRWFWIAGRWVTPPQPGWVWTPPYYGRRTRGDVAFVSGHWRAPGTRFVPPPPDVYIAPGSPPR